MLTGGPIQIVARIKVGSRPDSWLGYFHNMREAVDLLCPPPSYRVKVVQPNGEAHERVRRQLGGLVLSPEEASILLEHHIITYKKNHEDVTVTLFRLPSSGLFVPVKPVVHAQHAIEVVHEDHLAVVALGLAKRKEAV